jgi:uncharacterized protein with PIN domain
MRTIVVPPPSSRCELCGGELRLKQIEAANLTHDLDQEVFVCENCGAEKTYVVSHNIRAPTAA